MSNNDETDNNSPERKNLDNRLNDLFGLPNVINTDKSNLPVVTEDTSDEEDDVKQDFDDTRETLRELENMGKDVLDHFVNIARESESPRAIEVLANYMKTLSEISLSKIDIHERRKALKDKKPETTNPNMNIQNANIIMGTTADYLAQKKLKNNNDTSE